MAQHAVPNVGAHQLIGTPADRASGRTNRPSPFVRSFTLPGIVDRRERSRLIVLMAAELENWPGTPSVKRTFRSTRSRAGPPVE